MEVDFCSLDKGGALKKVNDVVEILNGLDFSRGRNEVVGMGFSDLHHGDVVMQMGMSFCDHHHYDGSDVKEKGNGKEILNGNYHNFLSIKNTDVGIRFGDYHHYDGADLKEEVNDDLVLNGNKLDFLNYFLEMGVFGHHDGDGTMEEMIHDGEILNEDDGQFQKMENVYVRMGYSHPNDGGCEILNENGGVCECLNVEHDYGFFGDGGVIGKLNDGVEIPNGNDKFQYAKNDLGFCEYFFVTDRMENEGLMMNYGDHFHGSDHDYNGDEGLVRVSGFSGYSFLYPWQSHLLNDFWTELVAGCVPYGLVLTLPNGS